jgi:hypothetical protein
MKHLRAHRFRLALIIVVLGLTLALGAPQAARAVEFDDDGVIAADEVIDDDVFMSSETVSIDGTVNGALFISGDKITVNGKVNGDLVMSGSEVQVNGAVNGNLAFIGQSLALSGVVKGSVFFFGGGLELEPSAVVGRNVFFNGFGMEMQPGSTVERDAVIGGYQALLGGQIERDVQAEVVALEIGGDIGRNVTAKVSGPGEGSSGGFQWPGLPQSVAAGLRATEDAHIGGALVYASPVEQSDAIKAVPDGGITYEHSEKEAPLNLRQRAGQWFLARVRDFLTLLVLGGLVVWRVPALLNRLADQARARPLPSAGKGLVIVVAGYAGAFVLAGLILVLGILMGVVTLGKLAGVVFGVGFSGLSMTFALFTLCVAYGSKLIVAYLIGRLVFRRLAPQQADNVGWPFVLGVVAYIFLRSIPVLGWLVGVAATLIGMGAMWLTFYEQRHSVAPA